MIDAKDLLPFISAELDSDSKEIYSRGLLHGVTSARPGAIDHEQALVNLLQAQLNQTRSDQAKRLFIEAYEIGVELRIEADRVAAAIYKASVGKMPLRLLRRLLAGKTRLRRMMGKLGDLQRDVVELAYQQRYGIELKSALLRTFDYNFVGALFKQAVDADARPIAQLMSETDFSAHNLERALRTKQGVWAGRFFLGRSEQDRALLIEDFEKQYGALQLEKYLRGWELEFVQDLVSHGKISWAKLLYICVTGVGTDEQGLRELLEAMSPSEIAHAREEFKRIWTERAPWYERMFPNLMGDLERRIWIETGGDCWFDIQEYFSCDRPFPENLNARLEQLYQHERSGYLLKRIDFFSREGMLMDHDVACVRAFHQHYLAAQQLDLPQQLRFRTLVRFAEFDCEVFRDFKHFVGNLSSNLIAAGSAAGAGYALGVYKVEIAFVMVCVGTVSILSRIVLKNLFKGRGYHREELLADTFFGILDGATLFTAYIFRQALLNFGTRFLTKIGLKTGISRLTVLMGGGRLGHLRVGLSELGGASER